MKIWGWKRRKWVLVNCLNSPGKTAVFRDYVDLLCLCRHYRRRCSCWCTPLLKSQISVMLFLFQAAGQWGEGLDFEFIRWRHPSSQCSELLLEFLSWWRWVGETLFMNVVYPILNCPLSSGFLALGCDGHQFGSSPVPCFGPLQYSLQYPATVGSSCHMNMTSVSIGWG